MKAEISRIIEPYRGKICTDALLEQIRKDITKYWVTKIQKPHRCYACKRLVSTLESPITVEPVGNARSLKILIEHQCGPGIRVRLF